MKSAREEVTALCGTPRALGVRQTPINRRSGVAVNTYWHSYCNGIRIKPLLRENFERIRFEFICRVHPASRMGKNVRIVPTPATKRMLF